MSKTKILTRRNILRGAGVALTLPWLESLAPRGARGQATLARRRFVAMTFPCGTADFWTPTGTGAGNAWKLSPILAPLAPLKSKVSVLSNVSNYSPWGAHIEPSHGHLLGALLSCTRANGPNNNLGGISVDQVIANGLGPVTRLPSLQVGLSTMNSSTDGLPGQHSRSISWNAAGEALYKLVDPQRVFDALFNVGPTGTNTRVDDQSVLDAVVAQATSLSTSLGRGDRARLDEFLTSVRAVEKSIASQGMMAACTSVTRPTESYDVGHVPATYDRNVHADLMIDLVALALQCDLTRVVTFMLDDGRSDFAYDFLSPRAFTADGSVPTTSSMPFGSLHGISSQNEPNSPWATINYWFVEKLARLCQKLQALPEAGGTVLDQSVVWFASEMHGGNHDGRDLPLLYVGGAGGRLAVDRRFDFSTRARMAEDLANVYLTFLKNVFDLPETMFGKGMGDYVDAGTRIVPELLA